MNIQERDETKQDALDVLLEEIYPYLRYGEIEKAFDALDKAIDENKNHYEYLVEKIKLLYMLYLKEEAYEVLDANIELLYSNIDKIGVDFISRRIYYHFYRNAELNTTDNSNNFDYLKITKEFINKYGFGEKEEQEISLKETSDPLATDSKIIEKSGVTEYSSYRDDYNLFGEPIIPEDELDSVVMPTTDETSENLTFAVDETDIFAELFTDETEIDFTIIVEEVEPEVVISETISEVTDEEEAEISEEQETIEEILIEEVKEVTTEQNDTEENIIIEDNPNIDVPIYLGKVTGDEEISEEQEVIEEISIAEDEEASTEQNDTEEDIIIEDNPNIDVSIYLGKVNGDEEISEEQETIEEISIAEVEETSTEQNDTEEDIIIEDNPNIDIPIYLGKVNGNDVFFESIVEHSDSSKEEKTMIIIESSHYTVARLVSLLVLGFIIGATIVYYL